MAVSGIEYDQLSKIQRLAMLLIVVGPEAAGQILKNFEDSEIEMVCKEINRWTHVPRDLQERILEEFSEIIGDSLKESVGGYDFAQRALEIARGDYKANTMLNRIEPGKSATNLMDGVDQLNSRQIFSLISREQAQTIAFVIANLSKEKAGQVFTMLTTTQQDEVIDRIANLEDYTSEQISRVASSIKRLTDAGASSPWHSGGGADAATELLKKVSSDIQESILERLEDRDPNIAQAIRNKMFTFDDLISLPVMDLQKVARDVQTEDLTLALKPASQELRKAFFGAVSKRAAETLKEELEFMGPVPRKAVDDARARIIETVRMLEEQDEISLATGDGGLVE
jgi:flagellar motor switch protein FliG